MEFAVIHGDILIIERVHRGFQTVRRRIGDQDAVPRPDKGARDRITDLTTEPEDERDGLTHDAALRGAARRVDLISAS
jgi:hypothetical protein